MGSIEILLFVFACWQGYADAQARVEYMNTPSISATPMVQPCQFVIPAVIKPLLSREPETPPPAPYPYPPIIIKEDNTLHHLLYFLIFAMKNRGPSMPYQYSGYDRCGCPDGSYMPYPMLTPGVDAMCDDAPGRDNEVTLVIRTDN